MNKYVVTENLEAVFAGKKIIPSITLWNRLESRPRTHDFDRALRAEIRDPLWMLCKQWQMGEFQGDDAGSPIFAKVHYETTQLTKYQAADNTAEPFDDDVPLEAKVERRAIHFSADGKPHSQDIRITLGRRWLKLIGDIEPGLAQQFIDALTLPTPDPDNADDAWTAAHRESWQNTAAFAGRVMDGYALLEHLMAAPGNHAHDLVTLANPASVPVVEAAEARFIAWYQKLFYQPADTDGSAWVPEHLEYRFATSAPKGNQEKHLVADEYYQGHLDWYNLDIEPDSQGLGDVAGAPTPADVEQRVTESFIPTPIQFDGMPNTRWWTFEEGATNFGDIDPDTTDINKLLLIEFGLVFANDWFLLPITLPAGTIANIRGATVTNVFGERTWIEAAGRGSDEDWQRWSMYTLATKGSDDVPADTSLLILPSVPKIQEGDALESVQLIRDEMANMVWGIETTIPLPSGEGKSGRSAAHDMLRYHRRLVTTPPADPPIENEAAIRYQLMTKVPENWIPFVPVHIDNSFREIQLRRAAMLRPIEGDPNPPERIEPRTQLLRQGLDNATPLGYDVYEEEVPRAGVRVQQSFQRTRWYGGEVFVWLGARKQTGRGERSSGLAFDQIPAIRRKKPEVTP